MHSQILVGTREAFTDLITSRRTSRSFCGDKEALLSKARSMAALHSGSDVQPSRPRAATARAARTDRRISMPSAALMVHRVLRTRAALGLNANRTRSARAIEADPILTRGGKARAWFREQTQFYRRNPEQRVLLRRRVGTFSLGFHETARSDIMCRVQTRTCPQPHERCLQERKDGGHDDKGALLYRVVCRATENKIVELQRRQAHTRQAKSLALQEARKKAKERKAYLGRVAHTSVLPLLPS